METRRGNTQSYAELLNALTPILRGAASAHLSRFNRQHYVEDAVQETLLTVHLKLHTYDESQPFMAWLQVVLKHKIIDYLRRNRVAQISIDDLEFWEPQDQTDPEEVTTVRDVKMLLERLKPPAGDIIHAMKIEGASVRELAEKHRLSEGNIKVIVHRGLQKLAAIMREEKAAA